MSKVDIKQYETITEFLAGCNAPCNETWQGKDRSSHSDRSSWAGTKTYEDAEKLAIYGWDKGLAKINDGLNKLNKEVEGRVIAKSIAGSHPDIARFIAGMPDCMNTRVNSDAAKKPCLDITVNCSYSATVNADDIMNYGVAMASVIDDLESAGYSIKLSVYAVSENNIGVTQGCMIAIKNHGEFMDMGKLIFFIAHPSFLRRLSFAHWESHNNHSDIGGGYGIICDLPKSMQGDLYFGKNASLSSCNTVERAIDFVKGIVIKQMPDLIDREAA